MFISCLALFLKILYPLTHLMLKIIFWGRHSTIFILYMRSLRQLTCLCHTSSKRSSWNLSPSSLLFWEGNGTPLQYSCLENPMDGGAWWAAVHGIAKSWIRLTDFTFTFHFHALEKEMATHSSILAWRIPGMREPGGLPSTGLHRVGHNWSDLAAAAAACLFQNISLTFSLSEE